MEEQASTSALIGERMVLEELRRAFDQRLESNRALDGKLQSLLSSASLIVSLVGLVQITVLRQKAGGLFWCVLALVLLLYVAMFAVILWAMRPATYKMPISRDWGELAQRYFGEAETDILQRIIADYLD